LIWIRKLLLFATIEVRVTQGPTTNNQAMNTTNSGKSEYYQSINSKRPEIKSILNGSGRVWLGEYLKTGHFSFAGALHILFPRLKIQGKSGDALSKLHMNLSKT